jgi:DNA repair protein RadC
MKKKVYLGEVQLKYKKARVEEEVNIRSSRDAYNILKDLIGEYVHHQEVFCAMYLNKANKVMWTEVINIGEQSSCIIDKKAIVKRALIGGCSAMILAHNHPSGNNTPSQNDKRSTKEIKDALKYFDIGLLDHIIVCDRDYYSFSDNGERSLS